VQLGAVGRQQCFQIRTREGVLLNHELE
jgi:hypothetical protein